MRLEDFKIADRGLRRCLLMTVLMYALHHQGVVTRGWSEADFMWNCDTSKIRGKVCTGGWWFAIIELFEGIINVCNLLAIVLIICLIYVDSLRDHENANMAATAVYVLCTLSAGLLVIVGVIIFDFSTNWPAFIVGAFEGLSAITASIFGIFVLIEKNREK